MRGQNFTFILTFTIVLSTLVGCIDNTPATAIQTPRPNAGSDADLASADLINAGSRPPKLGLCAGCHGETGKAVLADYPNLAGQNQRYLANALRAYKTGERQNAAMRSMVGTLSDAEIEALASYYAGVAHK